MRPQGGQEEADGNAKDDGVGSSETCSMYRCAEPMPRGSREGKLQGGQCRSKHRRRQPTGGRVDSGRPDASRHRPNVGQPVPKGNQRAKALPNLAAP